MNQKKKKTTKYNTTFDIKNFTFVGFIVVVVVAILLALIYLY